MLARRSSGAAGLFCLQEVGAKEQAPCPKGRKTTSVPGRAAGAQSAHKGGPGGQRPPGPPLVWPAKDRPNAAAQFAKDVVHRCRRGFLHLPCSLGFRLASSATGDARLCRPVSPRVSALPIGRGRPSAVRRFALGKQEARGGHAGAAAFGGPGAFGPRASQTKERGWAPLF